MDPAADGARTGRWDIRGRAAGNDALQEEELVGLEAIFGQDVRIDRAPTRRCEVHVPSMEAHVKVVVQFTLGPRYPSRDPPQVTLLAQHLEPGYFTAVDLTLFDILVAVPVLYECIAWLQGHPELYTPTAGPPPQTTHLPERLGGQTASDVDVTDLGLSVVHGKPFTERRSTFQAHLCGVKTVDEVQAMMRYLLSIPKIKNATHNILAYSSRTGGFVQDCDDDGETAAGGRLLHLLQVANVKNAAVCVTRWYGGVQLGPARFTHINNAARVLLVEHGYIPSPQRKRK